MKLNNYNMKLLSGFSLGILILLNACEKPISKSSIMLDEQLHNSAAINSKKKETKKIDHITYNVLENPENLDILTDYDEELWEGPKQWNNDQWQWKRLLKWDKKCDYIADIETYTITKQYQLISVQCVSGAYQPMYYLYLFDKSIQTGKPLLFGAAQNTDNPKEIFGRIKFNNETKMLNILTLSRGLADCGTYQVFSFVEGDLLDNTFFNLHEKRHQVCIEHSAKEMNSIAPSFFDYKQWPVIK